MTRLSYLQILLHLFTTHCERREYNCNNILPSVLLAKMDIKNLFPKILQLALWGRGITIEGVGWGYCTLPTFSFSAHLPKTNSARQCCIADKTGGESYLSQIGLERSLLVGKLGLRTPPAIFFSFAPALGGYFFSFCIGTCSRGSLIWRELSKFFLYLVAFHF